MKWSSRRRLEVWFLGFSLLLDVGTASAAPKDIFQSLDLYPGYSKTYPASLKNLDPDDPEIALLSVKLGQLTEKQFKSLKSYFKDLSQVAYSRDRDYELVDFLPPVMQALIDRSFRAEAILNDEQIGRLGNEIFEGVISSGLESNANCIGTALEIDRMIHAQNGSGLFHAYSPGRLDASGFLYGKQELARRELVFGDWVAYVQGNEIHGDVVQHLAIYISPELLFEKRDVYSEDPYRLVRMSDVTARMTNVLGSEYNVKYLRNISKRGFEMTNDWPEIVQEYSLPLHTLPPRLTRAFVSEVTTELNFGGGVEFGLSFVESFQIGIDPTTGRGLIKDDASNRFMPIR